MGIQKRRHSRARAARGRSQWKVKAVTLVACPQCHAPTVPHRVCPSCGFYAGRQVVQRDSSEK